MAGKSKRIEKSSGNVFAGIGVPGSDQELLEAKFAVQIYKLVKARRFTQAEAAGVQGAETLTPSPSPAKRERTAAPAAGEGRAASSTIAK